MKTLALLLMSVVVAILAGGCEDGPIIADVKVTRETPDGCGYDNGDPCSYLLAVSFKDAESGDHWYRGALYASEGGTWTLGEPVMRHSYGGDSTITIPLLAAYFDLRDSSAFEVVVHKFNSQSDAIAGPDKSAFSAAGDAYKSLGPFDDECNVICCTETADPEDRWYASTYATTSGIVGARADFRMCKWPSLCGGSSTIESFSAVYVDVYDANSGYWCQAGLESYRYDAHPFVEQYTYLERQGTSHWPAVFPGPAEGDEFNIGCLLDPSTGTWYLSMSGLTIISLPPDAGWVNRSGTRVDITGELKHHECDMFGTESWLMRLSNLEINDGSDWGEAPSLSVPRTNSLYTDEWNMFVADSGIFLYDMQPLPQ